MDSLLFTGLVGEKNSRTKPNDQAAKNIAKTNGIFSPTITDLVLAMAKAVEKRVIDRNALTNPNSNHGVIKNDMTAEMTRRSNNTGTLSPAIMCIRCISCLLFLGTITLALP
jgi:hypothetical protein